MNRLYKLIFSIFLVIGPLSLSANPLAVAPEQQPQEEPIPRPSKLSVSWWNYFEVDAEKLPEKITAFEEVLQELISNYSEGDLPVEAQSHVNKILLNLRLLPELKAQTGSTPIPPPPLKEKYTLEEVLSLLQEQEKVLREKSSLEKEVSSLSNRISKAQSQTDTLVASYLEIDPLDPNRFLKGLEIISKQVIVKVEQENLRIKSEKLATIKEKISTSEKELAHSKKHIEATAELIGQLKQRTQEKERELESAQNLRLEKEASLLGRFPETPRGQEELKNLRQEALLSKVKEELVLVELISLRAQEYFTSILIPTPQKGVPDLLFDLKLEKKKLQEAFTTYTTYLEEVDASETETEQMRRQIKDTPATVVAPMIEQRESINKEITEALNTLDDKLKESGFLIELIESEILASYNSFSSLFYQFRQALIYIWDTFYGISQKSLFKIGDVPLTLFGIFRAILFFIIALFISNLVQRFIAGIASRQRNIAQATFYTLGRLAHYTIVIIGFFVALASIGLNFRNLAIIAGALSVGIGFGLQSIVNNFLSGLIILFEQNIKVGDYLELETGFKGVVKEITVRSTLIRTNDGIEVIIPNSEIIGNKVINWTMKDAFVRFKIPFGVAYGTDKELVKKVVLQVAAESSFTLKNHPDFPEPHVRLTNLGDSALEFELVIWVNAVAARRIGYTTSLYLWSIHDALIQNGVEIPFPQRVVHFPKDETPSFFKTEKSKG